MENKGIFKAKYGDSLHGRDWARRIEPDDKAVLVDIGQQAHQYGYMGGKARAAGARRVGGKFVKADGTFTPLETRRKQFQELSADFQDMADQHRQVADAMERVSQAIEMIGEHCVVLRGRA